MRILWFANTPCSAADKFGIKNHFGGWLRSLEEAVSSSGEIDLSVAFYWHERMPSFKHGNTTFYPIFRRRNKTTIGRAFSRFLNKLDDAGELRSLESIVSECRPTLIHVHGTEDNFGLILESAGVPVIVSLQGILNPYVERFFSGIPLSAVRKFGPFSDKAIFSGYESTFRNMVKRADRERKILGQARHVAGRTSWDKSISGLLATKAVYHHSEEMLRSPFYERSWTKSRFGTPITILTTTGNNLYKGLETIVKVSGLLSSAGLKFRWVVVGLSLSDPLPLLVKKWMKADFQSLNIEFLGARDAGKLCELLCEADIFCQTSHIENSSNSLCEAQLVGMPIIASDAGGTRSIVEDNVSGLLFAPGDSYACAALIYHLAGNFEKAASLASKGKEQALKRHDRQRIVDEVIKLYHTVQNSSATS